MARIPQTELDRLKSEVSLERLAEAQGVKLTRKGADLHGCCPFHEDKTPSLVISPEKNLWNCLGACQEGGTVLDWVMKAEGVSFRHAVEILREGLPSLDAAPGVPPKPVKASTVRKLSPLADPSLEDQQLLARVVRYYHETLKVSPEALAYLAGRGLTHPELVEHFQLGFANRTLGYKLPGSDRKEGKEIRGRLRNLGILRKTGHEHLRGSLVVPLFDTDGQVVQMYGRKISTDLRKGTPNHLYLAGPQRGVFNWEGIRSREEVVLCESLMDALTFFSAGIRNVTTAFGAGGLAPDLWEAFEKAGTKRVLIAFDRDPAGDKAAEKLAGQLTERGIAAYRIQFPKGMDANEYAQKVGPAGKSLALVVRNALWMGEGQEPGPGRDLELQLEVTAKPAPSRAPAPEKVPPPPPKAPPAAGETAPRTASKEEAPAESQAPVPSRPPTPEPPAPAAPAVAAHRIPPRPPELELLPRGEDLWTELGECSYRIRGLGRNLSAEVLKVNLMVRREDAPPVSAGFHVDTLDLYSSRQRGGFVKEAARELGLTETLLKRDLGKLLLALEAKQEQAIQERLAPAEETVELTDQEREEALELLRDPRLLERILSDFRRCGVVGEETNKLMGYLAASSRKLSSPLAVVIQSNSAAGKSSLQEAVLAFMPEEELVTYSAMTGQSLFYMGETNLSHKILAIAEEEGAQKASYALKLLQSEGKLSIASTSKDPTSGRHVTQTYEVEGPVMIFLTTTATVMDEELLNRCLVLTVDEGREQTRAIHRLQRDRQTVEGLFEDEGRLQILRRHQNAQRLLEPVLVANPYARELTFVDHQTRARRDHMKYLTLIQTVALLHQHQREVKVARKGERELRYIEVTLEDIRVANRLAHEVLGRSLDELPPQTRRFLGELVEMVQERAKAENLPLEEFRFTRREVREWMQLGDTQVRAHLGRLHELEYVLVYVESGSQRKLYELVYHQNPESSRPYLPGLLDPEKLGGNEYDPPGCGAVAGGLRPGSGPVAGEVRKVSQPSETLSPSSFEKKKEEKNLASTENARLEAAGISFVVDDPEAA